MDFDGGPCCEEAREAEPAEVPQTGWKPVHTLLVYLKSRLMVTLYKVLNVLAPPRSIHIVTTPKADLLPQAPSSGRQSTDFEGVYVSLHWGGGQ
jgi:hypothetical protein